MAWQHQMPCARHATCGQRPVWLQLDAAVVMHAALRLWKLMSTHLRCSASRRKLALVRVSAGGGAADEL